MSKIVVSIFAFMALVQVATALQCYTCDKANCEEEMTKWGYPTECRRVATPNVHVGACLQQINTDPKTNKEVTTRKCIIAEKDAEGEATYKCSDSEFTGKTSVCRICTTDLCNSATAAVNFSFVTLLSVIAVYLIPKFM